MGPPAKYLRLRPPCENYGLWLTLWWQRGDRSWRRIGVLGLLLVRTTGQEIQTNYVIKWFLLLILRTRKYGIGENDRQNLTWTEQCSISKEIAQSAMRDRDPTQNTHRHPTYFRARYEGEILISPSLFVYFMLPESGQAGVMQLSWGWITADERPLSVNSFSNKHTICF